VKKNVLITGICGFMGSHLLELLSKDKNNKIYGIDNLSSNVISPNHDLMKDVVFLEKDVLDVAVEDLPKLDVVYHLASPVGPAGILKKTGVIADIIVRDVYWAIDLCKKNDCPLIFISTSEIYGFRENISYLTENDDKVLRAEEYSTRNEYSIAKLLAEIVIENVAKTGNLKYQIILPFNLAGPRQEDFGGFCVPRFVKQALSGEDITVFDDGEAVRAFSFIGDVVSGIVMTYEALDKHPNQRWIIGNPDNVIKIKDLAVKVKKLSGSKSTIVNVDPKTIYGPLYASAYDKIPNPEKIKRLLGWKCTKNTDEILKETIDFWRNRL